MYIPSSNFRQCAGCCCKCACLPAATCWHLPLLHFGKLLLQVILKMQMYPFHTHSRILHERAPRFSFSACLSFTDAC